METGGRPAAPIGKRLLRIFRAIYYMLRKGISKSKLLMDLHLVLKRGKLAGKVLTSLLTLFHHHQTAAANRHPADSKEVQFSFSDTPSSAFNYFHPAAKKRSSRHRRQDDSFDAEEIALAFDQLMNADHEVSSDAGSPAVVSSAFPTPSPVLMGPGRSPMMVRRLIRITDSPFPIQEEEGEGADGGRIDRAADEFIKNFYEQLRCQQLASAAATPDHYSINAHRRRRHT